MNTTLMRINYFFICILFIIDCSAQQHSIGISPYSAFISFKPTEGTYPDEFSISQDQNLAFGLDLRYSQSFQHLGFNLGFSIQYFPLDIKYSTEHYFGDAGPNGAFRSETTFKSYDYEKQFLISGFSFGLDYIISSDEQNMLLLNAAIQINSLISEKEKTDILTTTTNYHTVIPYLNQNTTSTVTEETENAVNLSLKDKPFLTFIPGISFRHLLSQNLSFNASLKFSFQENYPVHFGFVNKIYAFVFTGIGIQYRFAGRG